MTTEAQETINPQEVAKQIWDQLDAEEKGQAQPAPEAKDDFPVEQPQETADASAQAPAEQADAPKSEEAEANASQALLDKIAGLETMLGQVTQRLRHAEGHIGGLNSQLKQQQQLAAQMTAKGADAPTAGELKAAQGSAKAMEALKRDYPEFAEAMESALNEQLQALKATIPQQPVQPSVTPDDINLVKAQLEVEIRHPGWQERVQTPDFQGWLLRQPPEVQMLAASASPRDAIRLLDLHGEALKAVQSQRTQRLSAAAAIPSGRSGSQTRTKAVEEMTPEEYWRYLDELDKQR